MQNNRQNYSLLGCDNVVTLLRTDLLEERITSIITATRIGELGTMLAITSKHSTLQRNVSCHPDDREDTFLRNVGSYKSHTVSLPKRWHSSIFLFLCFFTAGSGLKDGKHYHNSISS
jgi:hypothetical protein